VVTAEVARKLLAAHGAVQLQPHDDWSGAFPLPPCVERFYREVGPVDIDIKSYGNSFFLPRLTALWEFQAGYRWNGLTGEPLGGWDEDWLVVADQGGDPFILARSSGKVLHALHGTGAWEPVELFSDLNTMAACLGQLGTVVAAAGKTFVDEDCFIRPEHRKRALADLTRLLGSPSKAELIVGALDWG
jgi:hypothetical protein